MSKVKISEHLPNGWEDKQINDICQICVGRDLREKCFDKEQSETFIHPVYSNTVENKGLYGYYNFPEFTGRGLTVVGRGAGLGTAFTRLGSFGAIGRLLVLFPDDRADANYLTEYINNKIRFYVESSGIPQLTGEQIGKYIVHLPPMSEQAAISDLLYTWATAIEKMERLIEAKEKRFKWLLKRLILRDKHTRGHIRDFTTEVSKRNSDIAINHVLSVTNNRGFVLPEDQFDRRVASSDLSNYKIVNHGQYAYNPSRINVGSIARLDNWDKGVLSPMYVVFKVNKKKVNSDFFLHWLSSHEAKERIRGSAQGSVRETVSFTDFGAIPFPLLLIEQQKVIAETLNTARQEITLLKKQADAYSKQKRGLMQKLLTGEWRVKTVGEVSR